jgi:hypothetical protein
MRPSPTPEEVAWAAGLFEGEGSWGPLGASILMQDREPMERFADIVGIVQAERLQVRDGKPAWRWRTRSAIAAGALFELFEPWMSERRIKQYLAHPIEVVPNELRACPLCGSFFSNLGAHARTCKVVEEALV